MKLPNGITDVADNFSRFPGIGQKSALKLALHMTKWDKVAVDHFADTIKMLTELKRCDECGFFSEKNLCEVCLNESRRSARLMCVVENISDYLAIENSGGFKGLYHILGGVLNPLMGIGPKEIFVDKLLDRINFLKIETVILAMGSSVEGDATCSYLKNQFPKNVLVQRIGFGIPMGGHLEHLDSLTINKAFENTRSL